MFTPRSNKNGVKTPDLRGVLDGRDILCEVKTINISDNEIATRQSFICRDGNFELSNPFFDKFDSVLQTATKQLLSYREDEDLRRIAYFVIHFDEPLEFSKDECNQKVSVHIDKMKQKKVEIRLHGFRQ